MVLMNVGWDRCIVPVVWSHLILMPSSLSGSLRSWMSNDPPMSLTILSIVFVELAASSPSSTYHPAISVEFLSDQKKTVVSASPALKPSFSSPCFRVWCHMRPDCFTPYMLLFSLHMRCSCPLVMKPSGWCI